MITPSSTFYCPGYYKNHGQTWPCWLPSGHGTVDLSTALEESCDVYFYNVGYEFYKRQGTELEDWAMRLGLGKTTGIDLPGEYSGLMPTPGWRQQHFTNAIDKQWSQVARSTWPSARATWRPRRCRWPSPMPPWPTAATW